MVIRSLVWGENVHEQRDPRVRELYPEGMHGCIAAALDAVEGIEATTATLQDPEHGLDAARLAATDVLLWWGHAAHDEVRDDVVDRVVDQVWAGMGLVVLHSGHFSKVFTRLMGTPCTLSWRNAGERERVWVVDPGHPVAAGLPPSFHLDAEEMYSEPFAVPEPLETVFVSWFAGGEVFRSGLTYRRGAGNVFYFRPGDENYPTYRDATVQQVLVNAVRWAHNPQPRRPDVRRASNVPVGPESTVGPRGRE